MPKLMQASLWSFGLTKTLKNPLLRCIVTQQGIFVYRNTGEAARLQRQALELSGGFLRSVGAQARAEEPTSITSNGCLLLFR
jgi:hypothetical protein